MIRVVNPSHFYHDGRGPELLTLHVASNSSHLLAIDFKNPDSSRIQHLKFERAQAYMFTPEEVANYTSNTVDWGRTDHGSIVSLGHSNWLESFNPHHLANCEHLRAMFYDEFLDVICEGVTVVEGNYVGGL